MLLLLAVAAAPAFAQQEVEVVATEVGPGLYMITGDGGNIGVSAGEDGVFLIDDQYAPLTDEIVAVIRGFSDEPIRFVLNTHWHFDHTGGNENLGEMGALIVAHDNVRRRMSVEQFIEGLDMTVEPSPESALPVVTFGQDVTFHLNDLEIHTFHVEHAHTDGDAIVLFRGADVIHMGDVYFNGLYPFIDISSGGSLDGTITATRDALEMIGDETRVIPGHGPLSNKAEMADYLSMLIQVRANVTALIEQGLDRDAVIAAKPSAEWDETWGAQLLSPEQFIGTVYDDLSRRRD
ncbi:MAG: MBL fold metallo-hydrolase [Gemmatimonadetes bacterium]|uniref:MBL fold metallo-hydrolase n=1 Tax=Candidatus Kutchimonas denitrificans TaxID=3056748 RepID=A0AAE4Z7N8_9BACT|nr:MBL fold metallo-hydrolase [Gemmatimonadota bacterium]NIR74217.1 MBL fold metallo-hydrolase [Candidatus Kutchimonas denitrificans]NIR99839.1 MBL fold metallo-hydrolase [Gemmatimonadota bacterium]NIT65428.1 MBL fold metallo-hydrolase [Gemmatimonadota bacterium]NIU51793.1 MBL fold metallo-hydrolase [Gemmatimonadota bacterium]